MTRTRVGLFVALLAFWLALSDQLEPLLLGLGVASAAGVAWVTGPFFAQALGERRHAASRRPLQLWRLLAYVPWLLWRTLVSSAEVAWVVAHPRISIEPGFLRFRTGLRSPLARAVLANSITLVPGTLTVRVQGEEFLVHALWPAAADDLRSAELQRRIAGIFLDPPDEPPETEWEPAGELT